MYWNQNYWCIGNVTDINKVYWNKNYWCIGIVTVINIYDAIMLLKYWYSHKHIWCDENKIVFISRAIFTLSIAVVECTLRRLRRRGCLGWGSPNTYWFTYSRHSMIPSEAPKGFPGRLGTSIDAGRMWVRYAGNIYTKYITVYFYH